MSSSLCWNVFNCKFNLMRQACTGFYLYSILYLKYLNKINEIMWIDNLLWLRQPTDIQYLRFRDIIHINIEYGIINYDSITLDRSWHRSWWSQSRRARLRFCSRSRTRHFGHHLAANKRLYNSNQGNTWGPPVVTHPGTAKSSTDVANEDVLVTVLVGQRATAVTLEK